MPRNGTKKYWVHLAIGAVLGWLVSIWALCGFCCIEKPPQKKYYDIGVAIGILVGIITWLILYFAETVTIVRFRSCVYKIYTSSSIYL